MCYVLPSAFVLHQPGVVSIEFVLTQVPEPDVSINSVDIDLDGAYLAAANSNGKVYIWSLTSGSSAVINTQPRNEISAHKRYVLKCTFSPDSRYALYNTRAHTHNIHTHNTNSISMQAVRVLL